jgi:hypothetical protein
MFLWFCYLLGTVILALLRIAIETFKMLVVITAYVIWATGKLTWMASLIIYDVTRNYIARRKMQA